jgi:hypothetical protein
MSVFPEKSSTDVRQHETEQFNKAATTMKGN